MPGMPLGPGRPLSARGRVSPSTFSISLVFRHLLLTRLPRLTTGSGCPPPAGRARVARDARRTIGTGSARIPIATGATRIAWLPPRARRRIAVSRGCRRTGCAWRSSWSVGSGVARSTRWPLGAHCAAQRRRHSVSFVVREVAGYAVQTGRTVGCNGFVCLPSELVHLRPGTPSNPGTPDQPGSPGGQSGRLPD